MTDIVERLARVIATALGDNYADAFKSKERWTAKRGISGGRFRDCNEPFQSDYLAAAQAALEWTEAATEIERLRKHAEALAAHLEWAHEGIERGDLDERMCCDGRMCGCMGALKGDEVLHFGREALAAYRAEYPEEK